MQEKSLIRMLVQPLLIAVALALLVRALVQIYSVPSASMAPTLQVGDHIAVTPYRTDTPARGDVVVFRSPANHAVAVKRIIGVPGDRMDATYGRVVVPAGSYFVAGDNRSDSYDSRVWGLLPRDHIVGRARVVLWGGERLPVRRIFKWIE